MTQSSIATSRRRAWLLSRSSAAAPGSAIASRNLSLALLTAAAAFNTIDRQALTLLTGPIRHAFQLTDSQVGLIGLTYGLLYALCAAPLAALADHTSRRVVISACVAVFSAATVLCGLAPTYVWLLASRAGVAVSEAGTAAPSRSIVADLFAPRERTFPMTVFAVASKPGGFIAFLLGGWLAQWYGWRWTFILLGAPGLVLALLVLLMREPTRGESDGVPAQAAQAAKPPALGETLRYLSRTPTFWNLLVAGSAHGVFTLGVAFWMPIYLQRTFGLKLGLVGTLMAVYTFVFGTLGVLGTGWIAQKLQARDVRWSLRLVILVTLIGTVGAALMFMTQNPWMVLIFAVVQMGLNNAPNGPAQAVEQSVIPARMRNFAGGLSAMIAGLAGMGFGPQVVGWISDALKPTYGAASIRIALLYASLFWVWSAAQYALASVTLRSDLRRANEANQHDALAASPGPASLAPSTSPS